MQYSMDLNDLLERSGFDPRALPGFIPAPSMQAVSREDNDGFGEPVSRI